MSGKKLPQRDVLTLFVADNLISAVETLDRRNYSEDKVKTVTYAGLAMASALLSFIFYGEHKLAESRKIRDEIVANIEGRKKNG